MGDDGVLPWAAVGGDGRGPPPTKDVWGPLGWAWLHRQAIDFPAAPAPPEQAAAFIRFWAFVQTLPCAECRVHATRYAREFPPDFSGSAGYQTWAWHFHNAVNRRLGKPLMSAEEYQAAYAEEIAASYWRFVRN
jgi:hypothetical protein